MSTLEFLKHLASSPTNPFLEEWRSSGRKVVGYFCSYVPEEILYAADILPYRVRAPGCTNTSSADVYFSHLNCTFVRSCFQFVLEGRYDFLDGLVITNSCDHVRRLYDVVREVAPKAFPFVHLLNIPHTVGSEAIGWYSDQVAALRDKVEALFDLEITDAGLRNAIDVYNETRSLLKELYELRQAENPPLSGAESLSIVLAGTMMPKDRYNQLLRDLLAELNQRERICDYRARLMIAGGGGCDNPAFYQLMEDLGGLVVTDSLCLGSRYFWQPVEVGDDAMLGLATSYLQRPSCALFVDRVRERSEFIKEMVERFKVDGVVYQRIRYCDLWGGQILHVDKVLREADIPLLDLEREYMLGSVGQVRTRVQAFLETIEG
jgi:benzoyl-CoA reductase subunit C